MALALIAPELLVSWAFRQWLVARKVTEYGEFQLAYPRSL